jgi:hypothetical protein
MAVANPQLVAHSQEALALLDVAPEEVGQTNWHQRQHQRQGHALLHLHQQQLLLHQKVQHSGRPANTLKLTQQCFLYHVCMHCRLPAPTLQSE